MQILAISKPRNDEEARLLHMHHQLRARIFSARLGWDVDVIDGRESDAFDALMPTYILAISNNGDVAGCARLLPALGPTMVTDVFSSLLPNGQLNERILARVGWPLQRLGEPKKIGVTMAVAGILPADAGTFQKLRPSNYRSECTPLCKAA